MVAFYKKWKKYNEIQLTKNKIDFNNWKKKTQASNNITGISAISMYFLKTPVIYLWCIGT